MGRTATRWALYTAMLFLVGCDHATKVVAKDALGLGRVITLIHGWLDLRYTENFDTAFSLTRGWGGTDKGAVLTVVATPCLSSWWDRYSVDQRSVTPDSFSTSAASSGSSVYCEIS